MDPAIGLVIANAHAVDCGVGRVVYIKPLTPEKLIKWLGRIPPAFAKTIEAQQDPVRAKKAEVFARDNPHFAERWVKCLVAESIVAAAWPDENGESVIGLCAFVDKPQHECTSGEISLALFEGDAEFVNAVVAGVSKLNGWTQEAAESAKPFLQGPGLAWLLGVSIAPLLDESARRNTVTAH